MKTDLGQSGQTSAETPEAVGAVPAGDHFRAACIMASALRFVRGYPDFDKDADGNVPLFGQVIDAALKGEIHPTLQFVADVRMNYGADDASRAF